jgi:hypothetical protein
MSKIKPPPTYDKLVSITTAKVSPSWLVFFQQLFTGDQGQAWTPTFSGLTFTGAAPTLQGYYYQLSSKVCKFNIVITPSSGNNTSMAAAGYVSNFPLKLALDDVCFVSTSAPSAVAGSCDAATNRILLPTWAAITSKITISGTVIAS